MALNRKMDAMFSKNVTNWDEGAPLSLNMSMLYGNVKGTPIYCLFLHFLLILTIIYCSNSNVIIVTVISYKTDCSSTLHNL